MHKFIFSLLALPLLLGFSKVGGFYQSGTIVFLVFISFVLIIALAACCGVYSVLRPQTVISGSEQLSGSAGRSFVMGVLTYALLILFLVILEPMGKIKGILVLPVLTVYALMLLNGFTALAHSVGEKILSNINSPKLGSSLFAVLFGSVSLLVVSIIPIVGWILLVVMSTFTLGISVRQLFAKKAVVKAI
jgi:hypothetical protein